MDILSFMLGKAAGGGGGGGGDITVEQLNVSSNNTYTAPSGKAYSPVVVNVPNSYTQSDEGKVVSNGALVAQSSDTVTENGTVDTTLINSLLVNVSGGGGGPSNIITGTFTPSADGVGSFNTGYTGNGFPVIVVVCVNGGIYDAGSDWVAANKPHAVEQIMFIKNDWLTAPNYSGTTAAISTADLANYAWFVCTGDSSNPTAQFDGSVSKNNRPYNSADPSTVFNSCLRVANKSTFNYYAQATPPTGAGLGSLLAGVEYRYLVVYSE